LFSPILVKSSIILPLSTWGILMILMAGLSPYSLL
jgi:hypothetical protein